MDLFNDVSYPNNGTWLLMHALYYKFENGLRELSL